VGSESVAYSFPADIRFVEHASASDLVNIARKEIDPERESVLDPRVLDLTGFEAVDYIVQFFLRSDYQPQRTAPLLERLRQTLEVKHARDATSDVLAHLVDDENYALCPCSPTPEQIQGPAERASYDRCWEGWPPWTTSQHSENWQGQ
jgi:hypothetical protein